MSLSEDKAFIRITPAYAGRSPPVRECVVRAEDHPRVRGEKRLPRTPGTARRGSPPRTRGEEKIKSHLSLPPRITPAYAGRSRQAASGQHTNQDHPRVRGEKVRPAPLSSLS